VSDEATFKLGPQLVDVLEQRPDRVALDFVRAAELPDHQLAIGMDHHLVGAELPGCFQSLEQGRILGDIIRGFAQEKRFRLQPLAVEVFEDEAGRGRTGLPDCRRPYE
jgi:hypothetical protein